VNQQRPCLERKKSGLIRRQLLYPLSYGGKILRPAVDGDNGNTTPCSTSKPAFGPECTGQLLYHRHSEGIILEVGRSVKNGRGGVMAAAESDARELESTVTNHLERSQSGTRWSRADSVAGSCTGRRNARPLHCCRTIRRAVRAQGYPQDRHLGEYCSSPSTG